MKLTITTMLLGGGAVLLIWAGITDRNPVHVMRAILTGNEIPERGSWGGTGPGGTPGASTDNPPATGGFVEV